MLTDRSKSGQSDWVQGQRWSQYWQRTLKWGQLLPLLIFPCSWDSVRTPENPLTNTRLKTVGLGQSACYVFHKGATLPPFSLSQPLFYYPPALAFLGWREFWTKNEVIWVCSFLQQILSAYYIPCTSLVIRDSVVNKTKSLPSRTLRSSDRQQRNIK